MLKSQEKNVLSKTTPISSFILFSCMRKSLSNILILPLSILIMFKIDLIKVVLPAPFSPIKPTIRPLGISKLILPSSNLSYFF